MSKDDSLIPNEVNPPRFKKLILRLGILIVASLIVFVLWRFL